jgi:hypothetical protein
VIVRAALIVGLVLGTIVLLVGVMRARVRHHGVALTEPPPPPTRDAAAVLRQLDGATDRELKPWLTDAKAYAADHPGRWLTGRTASAYASESEAVDAARADAARAAERLFPRDPRRRGADPARRIAAAVRDGLWEADRQIEHFDRPYGTVWTAAVLVDASDRNVNPLLRRYAAESRTREVRAKVVAVLGAIATAGAWLTCAALNWATRGFFARRLRAGAVGVTALAAGVAIAMFVV